MARFPVLLSIPHGGDAVPPEIEDRIAIAAHDLRADADAFTRAIYGLHGDVAALVETPVARVYVDLNREENDLPPKNPDGVIKTHTCHGVPIYQQGRELDAALSKILIDRYYHPYHRKLEEALAREAGIRLALDCHSMLAEGPPIGPDPGKPRPAICLGTNRGRSCPQPVAHTLARCFAEAFGLNASDVTLNQPFSGGYITRRYGTGRPPWVQVELNRGLYLQPPWFDAATGRMDPARLETLRAGFSRTAGKEQKGFWRKGWWTEY